MKHKKFVSILLLSALLFAPALSYADSSNEDEYIDNATYKIYKKITKEDKIIAALDSLKGTFAEFSRNAIMGDNLTGKPVKIEFRDLGALNEAYADFDALGWKIKDRLYIFINQKHYNAPKEAIASILAHEAIHQDELNSLNEETYCWTLEAAVWTHFTDEKPELADVNSLLVDRENTIKRLFIKGDYTDKYIRKSVVSNSGYQGLPSRSPGFEDENL